ncbi:DUF2087 domain-containing protein [Cellulomonas sp. PhB143]|uniref:DUF2087 domain-containing protein n=1 Tax=Cellulomonas sp. PhB143 TaxID=2485186 RepID=UPI000F4871E7|nr:DUF2087 domain-containing protein [Cellulomonas sp. PhB143]ROS74544.1 hypothetical protein EDF32_2291 [Cellulomonas sp. PhB143]
MSNAWRGVVAAMADEGRFALLGAVVTAHAQDAPLRRLDLSADQRRRLGPLLGSGLVVADGAGRLRPDVGALRALLEGAEGAPGADAGGADPERFLRRGRLEVRPRRREDRDRVLRYVASRDLPLQEPLTEREVTLLLSRRGRDPVGLRREMVDAGVLRRTTDGRTYWRERVTEFDDLSGGGP